MTFTHTGHLLSTRFRETVRKTREWEKNVYQFTQGLALTKEKWPTTFLDCNLIQGILSD